MKGTLHNQSSNDRTKLIPQSADWLKNVFFGSNGTFQNPSGFNLDIEQLASKENDPQCYTLLYENSNIPKNTLIVVTYDEADFENDTYSGPNQIYTVLLGDMIPPGTVIDTPYNHYNLLHTVEKNFGLKTLGKNDFQSNWFRFLWNESFSWQEQASKFDLTETCESLGSALAVTCKNSQHHLIFSDSTGQLYDSFSPVKNIYWHLPAPLGVKAEGDIALATLHDTTVLVFMKNGRLSYMTHKDEWDSPRPIIVPQNQKKTDAKNDEIKHLLSNGKFSLISYFDYHKKQDCLMFCWVDTDHQIYSMKILDLKHGFQGVIQSVNQSTDGIIRLGQLGASVYLIYKDSNNNMNVKSYNTAKFNEFEYVNDDGFRESNNDTSLHQWSAIKYEVGAFMINGSDSRMESQYSCEGKFDLATISGEIHLIQSAPINSTNPKSAFTEVFGFTGIYTPKHHGNNGHGTLDEAGWTAQKLLPQISLDSSSSIAMCLGEEKKNKEKLLVVWSNTDSNELHFLEGGYRKH
jgi:hypothetical protein